MSSIARTSLRLLCCGTLALAACTRSAAPETDAKAETANEAQQARTDEPRIFVANYKAETVSVIEGDPGTEVRAIPLDGAPHGMDVRPTDPPLLAVARSTGFSVALIDPVSLEQKADIETSKGPQHVRFSNDGERLFVVSPYTFEMHVIDVDDAEVAQVVAFDKKPRRIVVDPNRARIFVLLVAGNEHGGSEIAVIDESSLEITKKIPVGEFPRDLALGNHGKTLVSASFDESTLSVVDTDTLEVVATHDAMTGYGLAVHPAKPIAYSSESFDSVVQVIDLESGREIETITAGRWPNYPAFGPNGRYVYIPHEDSDSLVKIDTTTNQVAAKIAVGVEPVEVAIYHPRRAGADTAGL